MAGSSGGPSPWIQLDPDGGGALHVQLYEGLRAAILSGRIPPGSRLPSSRALAKELGVSRTTVLAAFRQLTAEGYLTGRVGSGTYVSSSLPETAIFTDGPLMEEEARPSVDRSAALSERGARFTALGASAVERDPVQPFLPGVPSAADFPWKAWRRLMVDAHRQLRLRTGSYPDPFGYPVLREELASYLRATRGLRCDAGQVIVTTGAQQAFSVIAHLLTGSGDEVWMEEPGWNGARRAFEAASVRVVPVAVDDEGLQVRAGERAAPRARLAYVTPSHQFPLGGSMSLGRRLELLEWADRAGAYVVEDDYDGEYRFEGRPLQALQGLDGDGRVIYVGTFSKILFPSLRLGYVVLPAELVEPFAAAREILGGAPPAHAQWAVAELMRSGRFASHIRRMRALYRERRDLLVAELRRRCDGLVRLGQHDAGMHLTAFLDAEVSEAVVTRAAGDAGLTALGLAHFCARSPARAGLVLGFAGYAPQSLAVAARELAAIIGGAARTGR